MTTAGKSAPKPSLAERALELIAIPSVTGAEAAIADYLEAWARRTVSRGEVLRVGNSLVVGSRGSDRPTLALYGHTDTVPPHRSARHPELADGRLHGRGASDMKGALAVMMRVMEVGCGAAVNPLCVFYEGEEGPAEGSGLGPLFTAAPELRNSALCVAMEPTDGAVQVGAVGSLHARVTFRGRAAHSARPWQGVNAIHAAGDFLAALHRRERREVRVDGFSFYEVMSATLAAAPNARNVVPDTFEVGVNYRFAPGTSEAQALEEVRAAVGGRAEVSLVDSAPPGAVCVDNPMVQKLVGLTGRPAEPKQAWTDVARLTALGLDAVNFGPGESAQAHQPDESAPVAALDDALRVLLALLESTP